VLRKSSRTLRYSTSRHRIHWLAAIEQPAPNALSSGTGLLANTQAIACGSSWQAPATLEDTSSKPTLIATTAVSDELPEHLMITFESMANTSR
jgi:hypothetical protein